jgi:hypothetical protein
MPNTPCLIGESAAGLAGGKFATPADIDLVVAMFSALGVVHPVSEHQLDGDQQRCFIVSRSFFSVMRVVWDCQR